MHSKDMQLMFEAMNTPFDSLVSSWVQENVESLHNHSIGGQNRSDGNSHHDVSIKTYMPKFVKLDFPRYGGLEDLIGWICRDKQFFAFHQTKGGKGATGFF